MDVEGYRGSVGGIREFGGFRLCSSICGMEDTRTLFCRSLRLQNFSLRV